MPLARPFPLPSGGQTSNHLNRRDFVRAAGGMLISVGIGSGCGGGAPTNSSRGPQAITPVFHSDWNDVDPGTSSTAVSDRGKWDFVGGFGHEVVAAAGLGFPSAKVCKFVANRQNNGWAMLRKTGMPIPPVGTTRYYRWYVR